MRLLRSVLVLLFLLPGLPLLAASSSADAPHLRVELLTPGDKLYGGDQLNYAGLYFKLEPGWHIYWMNAGDAGDPPRIHWTLPDGITAGAMEFPAPRRLPLSSLMDYGYEDEVLFPLKLRVADSVKAGPVTLHAKVDWLVCRDSCIPGSAELELQRSVDAGSHKTADQPGPLFIRFLNRLPRLLPASGKARFQSTKHGFLLSVDTGQRETDATFFPEDQDIIDNPAPQKLTTTPNGLILDLKKDAGLSTNPTQLKGVLELSGGRTYEIKALAGAVAAQQAAETGPSSEQIAANDSTVANLPGASIPAAAGFQAPASQPASAKTSTPAFSLPALIQSTGLAFLGGLLLNLMPCVFPVLFLKGLALVHSGHKELHKLRAHGLVYAVGVLVSLWALVGVLLILRAAGTTLGWGFQFQSPVFLVLMASLLFFLGLSLAGQFEIGLTLTSAGGSLAQKQGYTGSFFTGVLAVIVATPCTAPFMGAAIGYALSQSSLVTFAVFTALALGLAAPYVALTLQPAWTRLLPKPGAWMEVLRQAVAVPIFATVIWLAWVLVKGYGADTLWSLLGSFLLLAVAGWFLGRWPATRWAAVIAALILLSVVALAIYGQKLSNKVGHNVEQDYAARGSAAQRSGGWESWSAAAVSRDQAEGRPVFVDFTASWCLSCQVNERVALNRPEVQQAFQSANVALLRADWTRHDEAITQALTALGRSGVPAYALYVPGETSPRLLPEVLTPGIVTDALGKLPKTALSPAR
jgi:thiol:disulfide interchange protein DsbD